MSLTSSPAITHPRTHTYNDTYTASICMYIIKMLVGVLAPQNKERKETRKKGKKENIKLLIEMRRKILMMPSEIGQSFCSPSHAVRSVLQPFYAHSQELSECNKILMEIRSLFQG